MHLITEFKHVKVNVSIGGRPIRGTKCLRRNVRLTISVLHLDRRLRPVNVEPIEQLWHQVYVGQASATRSVDNKC